jgi:imidazole glycerol-phosphate synthase subunit HisF
MLDMVRRVADTLFIPFCVGGGIRTIDDIRATLLAGADKVSINSAAVKTPELINQGAWAYGSQCIVVAIDPKLIDGQWIVHINGGRVSTGKNALEWAKEVEARGAGEILLTSMDRDGTKAGYDLEMTAAIADAVSIPVIASGGAGSKEDFYQALTTGKADAALAASLFHYNELRIGDLKAWLAEQSVPVRQMEAQSQ